MYERCVMFSILTLLLLAGCREASTPSASPVEQTVHDGRRAEDLLARSRRGPAA